MEATTSGQRILTTGRIAGGDFSLGVFNVTLGCFHRILIVLPRLWLLPQPANWNAGDSMGGIPTSGQLERCLAACQKIPTSCPLKSAPSHVRILTPILYTVPWAHVTSPHPKRHLDRFSRFCRAHVRYRQTDGQTTLLPSVAIRRTSS